MPGTVQVVIYDGYVEAIVGKESALSGEALAGAVERWEGQFGFPITCYSRRNPDGFAIHLHGGGDRVADELRDSAQQMLATAQPEEEAPMEVRYVWHGLAYIEPRQRIQVGRLVNLASNLSRSIVGQPVSVVLRGNALCLCVRVEHELCSPKACDGALTALVLPTYRLHTRMSGGISGKVARVQLRVPDSFQLRGSALPKLPFVLADPPPAQSMHGEAVTLYLSADPRDVENVWLQAAEAALSIGAYPVGDFLYNVSPRLTLVYHPLTLTGR